MSQATYQETILEAAKARYQREFNYRMTDAKRKREFDDLIRQIPPDPDDCEINWVEWRGWIEDAFKAGWSVQKMAAFIRDDTKCVCTGRNVYGALIGFRLVKPNYRTGY